MTGPGDLEYWLDAADPRRIPARLIEKYAMRGPRYTSYPTAPQFGPIDLADLHARWRARNGIDPDPGLSIYVHIPFCRSLCAFCGCHTHVRKDPASESSYVDDLLEEMDLALGVVDRSRPVRQAALGGGTPNFLADRDLDRLLAGIRSRFDVGPDAELSAELDPRTVTMGQLDLLLSHGWNRLSLGVQDFDPAVMRNVRRVQDEASVQAVVDHLRSAGCTEINFDLIYGLPGQSPATAEAAARETIRLAPTRIALYNYAHVPWMKPHQKALGRIGLPGPAEKAEIQGIVAEALVRAGWIPIGMDHFARPEDGLARALANGTLTRGFMGYTTGRGLDLAAFGSSGISAMGSTYAQASKDLAAWRAAVREGRSAVDRGFLLGPEDLLRRDLILDLFCNFRVDLAAISSAHGADAQGIVAADLERLAPMADDGLVEIRGGVVLITPAGRPFVRNVCMAFDRYLESDPGDRRYSSTL